MTVPGAIIRIIDAVNEGVGRAVAWLAAFLVLIQFTVVMMRYVFGINYIWLQEILIYMFATLFMIGAGYTLKHGGHVRVDLFYRTARTRTRAWVDLLGVVFLLVPVCVATWITAKPYVDASWAVREGSRESAGLQGVYLLKTEILIFAVLLGLQGVAMAVQALRVLAGRQHTISEEEAPRL